LRLVAGHRDHRIPTRASDGGAGQRRAPSAEIIRGVLLAVDVGNTQSHLGVFEAGQLVEHWRFATQVEATADELAVGVSTMLALRGMESGAIDGSIVSSVVPQLTPEYLRMSERYLQGRCLILGPGVKTGMPIQLENPRELGADRLANAVAAYDRLGGP
jgi:type III pantothenate kinase